MLTEVSRGLLSIARKLENRCDSQTLLRRFRSRLNAGFAERFDETSGAWTGSLSSVFHPSGHDDSASSCRRTLPCAAVDASAQFATLRRSPLLGVLNTDTLESSRDCAEPLTHRGATHVVKTFNPREHPELAANEFFCMQAAHHAGIPVPAVELSNNRRLLIIERFDLRSDGTYLGCEDFCVLNGVRPHGRYDGSYEVLARRIGQFVSPQQHRAALEQLFLMLALSCAIENGDAHLKNFAVVYEHADATVSLAPAYDMVSTTPYVPRDVLALTLGGSKEFPSQRRLVAFGRQSCGLTAVKVAELLDRVGKGVRKASAQIRRYIKQRPEFGRAGEHLIATFDRGLLRINTE